MAADAVEVGGHLQTDDTAADDHQVVGNLPHVQNLPVGEDKALFQSLLDAGDGRRHRDGAAGDDELLGDVGGVAHLDDKAVGVFAVDGGHAVYDSDLVAFHLHAYAGNQLLDHAVFPIHHLAVVDLHILGGDAVVVAVLGVVIDLGGVEERLGGNAALVEADAAQGSLLHHRGFQPGVSRPLRGQITGGAAADYD